MEILGLILSFIIVPFLVVIGLGLGAVVITALINFLSDKFDMF